MYKLVIKGAQDKHVIGKPQANFFLQDCVPKQKDGKYQRYANFSSETISVPFQGCQQNPWLDAVLHKHGDFINKIYLKLDFTKVGQEAYKMWAWKNNIGFRIIEYAEIKLDDEIIQRITGEDMIKEEDTELLKKMIGNTPDMLEHSYHEKETTLYVPLHFWFSKEHHHSLPISFMENRLSITIKLQDLDKCITYDGHHAPQLKNVSCELLVEYIFLEVEERSKIAKKELLYHIPSYDNSNRRYLVIKSGRGYIQEFNN